MMSSMLSPTMIRGIGFPEEASGLAPLVSTPHAWAMCRIPAGEGFGGRKSRVTMGWNAEMCEGRCVVRRCVTGVLYQSLARKHKHTYMLEIRHSSISLSSQKTTNNNNYSSTYSKFLVQIPLFTPCLSRNSISVTRPA